LFAALEIATGTVTAATKPRHRHQEFLAFLKQVARAYPDRELHLVMDNYAAHKRVQVRDWLAANPRVNAHYTPTSGSWLTLVEVWFSIIERQAIHRGTFGAWIETFYNRRRRHSACGGLSPMQYENHDRERSAA
jgi:transposase